MPLGMIISCMRRRDQTLTAKQEKYGHKRSKTQKATWHTAVHQFLVLIIRFVIPRLQTNFALLARSNPKYASLGKLGII